MEGVTMKIKWKVSPKEKTGRYASFYPRHWPSAYYEDGNIAVSIKCNDGMGYHASYVKSGNHSPLVVYIYDYSEGVTERKIWRLKKTFSTLAEAKLAAQDCINRHPEVVPR